MLGYVHLLPETRPALERRTIMYNKLRKLKKA